MIQSSLKCGIRVLSVGQGPLEHDVHRKSEIGQFDPIHGLICLREGKVGCLSGLDTVLKILEGVSVFFLTLPAGIHPFCECGFLLLCAADDV